MVTANASRRYPRIRDQSEYKFTSYVEGCSEKPRRIHGSHKIRSFFYTKNVLRKTL